MRKTHRFGVLLGLILALGLLVPQRGTALPSPPILILSPGDLSTITTPILLEAEIQLEEAAIVRVALVDRQEQLLSRQLHRLSAVTGSSQNFKTKLNFEIPDESTLAQLTLATYDEAGRPIALRSVTLTLQAAGRSELHTQPVQPQWLVISQPEPAEIHSGSPLIVKGRLSPITERPIIFELITDSGGVIGSSMLAVDSPGETVEFEILLAYAFITRPRDVRLVIRQTANSYADTIILDSLIITLTP